MADIPVTLRHHPTSITVRRGETILEAALRHGVAYPHSCQAGNCGACKSRLLDGEVTLRPHAPYALPDRDRAAGLILACRADPSGPCTVDWVHADENVLHPTRLLTCRVARIDHTARDTSRVFLDIDAGGPFTFSAGQYAELTFAGCPPRDFSMANRPNDLPLEFHIRHYGPGGASHHVASNLAVGDPVTVRGPMGGCFLRELHTGPIIAVAGGTGLAPIWSILATALAKGMTQPIDLFIGVRDEPDIYLETELTATAARHANFRYTIVLSEPAAPTTRNTGWLHDAVAATTQSDMSGHKAYVAGPPPMVDAVTRVLRTAGLNGSDLHADAFTPAVSSPPGT